MTMSTVAHDTFVIERIYNAPVAQVFRAWADPMLKARVPLLLDLTADALSWRQGPIIYPDLQAHLRRWARRLGPNDPTRTTARPQP